MAPNGPDRMCVGSVYAKGSIFQAQFHCLAPRIGRRAAIVAVAHAMLVAMYHVLETGQPYSKDTARPKPSQTPIGAASLSILQKLGVKVTIESTINRRPA